MASKLKTKDRYKKGDKVKYTIEYGASPMSAKSKAEKSNEKVGRVSKVTKDFTGKLQYVINNITIGHSSVLGLAENTTQGENTMIEARKTSYKTIPANIKSMTKSAIEAAAKELKLTGKVGFKAEWATWNGQNVLAPIDFGSYDAILKKAKTKLPTLKENKQGESKMKITKRELVEMIKTVVKEETEYQKFFKEKLGDKSLGSMSDEEKKAFFNMIDKEWKGEKNETLEPVSQAAGEPEANPTQRLKAKKRDQMLAQERVENYVRKIIREELKFVMFNEVPGGTSRKVAKKRISQMGSTTQSL